MITSEADFRRFENFGNQMAGIAHKIEFGSLHQHHDAGFDVEFGQFVAGA